MVSSPDSFDGLPMASPESPSSTLVSFTDVKVVPEQQQKGLEQTILHLEKDVFMEVEPILRFALDGHNVCIMAYGQTGTGKTFTMYISLLKYANIVR
ncbi:hypothetical protein Syun_016769 [Stephania yunnanensis]|uniref:Kinesin motor domain-containing protein n=1 Tax=Stephania yunnanensis TaxID=152371 RepID=A0AAP0P1S8_9MAGN